MSQFDFGDLNSPLSGAQLCNDVLEPWRDAVNSMHSGTARPSYVVPQMLWVDISSTPWVLKMFQGSDDIVLGNLDPSTLLFTPTAVSASTLTGLNDPNTTGSTNVQGQLDYATKNATQTVAEAGTNNTDRMTALRTKQAIDAQVPLKSMRSDPTGTDVGDGRNVSVSGATTYTLPTISGGGTWLVMGIAFNPGNGVAINTFSTGLHAEGSTITVSVSGHNWLGYIIRVG